MYDLLEIVHWKMARLLMIWLFMMQILYQTKVISFDTHRLWIDVKQWVWWAISLLMPIPACRPFWSNYVYCPSADRCIIRLTDRYGFGHYSSAQIFKCTSLDNGNAGLFVSWKNCHHWCIISVHCAFQCIVGVLPPMHHDNSMAYLKRASLKLIRKWELVQIDNLWLFQVTSKYTWHGISSVCSALW